MRFLLHLTAAALLVATGIGGMTPAAAADREVRAAVVGRQKIRAELSAALEKGYLTRMDQYQILLHAKEVLTAEDLQGLEQTLDRIAKQQAAASRATTRAVKSETTVPAGTVVRDEMTVPHEGVAQQQASTRRQTSVRRDTQIPQRTKDIEPGAVTPSEYAEYEESKNAELPTIGGLMPKKAKALGDSLQMEEIPAGIGRPAIHPDAEDSDGCGSDLEDCEPRRRWLVVDLFSSVDAFKGPIDLANANGNFGVRLGVNAAVPVAPSLGVGLQAGTAGILSNLKGSPFPEPNATIRDQIFTTVGMFQRINREERAFTWGFAYDWLFDDYYSGFHFGQWRVKAAFDFDPCNEIGIAAALPEHGSTGQIPNFLGGVDELHFKPITQGYLFWRHTWCNDASLAGRFGVAERPGEFVFGGEGRVPVTKNMALSGDFSYIMPLAAGGAIGQTQEIWNVSVGIEIVLGGFGHGCAAPFQPFFPVANNGSMAVRELGQ